MYKPDYSVSDEELIDIFGEETIIPILQHNLKINDESVSRLKVAIKDDRKRFSRYDSFTQYFLEQALLPQYTEEIKRLERLMDWQSKLYLKATGEFQELIKERKLNDEMIMSAREYPILDLLNQFTEMKKSGRHHKGLCVFHKEKTPSLFAFTDSNRFYCFGCQASGDSITFLMKVKNLSFWEAIQELSII